MTLPLPKQIPNLQESGNGLNCIRFETVVFYHQFRPGRKGKFVNDTPGVQASEGQSAQSFGFSVTANHKIARKRHVARVADLPQDAPIIEASGVNYILDIASRPLHILKDVALRVEAAEVVAIVGPSGSGKTSLLMLLAGANAAASFGVMVVVPGA